MKTLKFHPNLVPLVLAGSKNKTWRLWDEKELKKGDILKLINSETKETFAKAIVIEAYCKPMAKINKKDKEGHEDVGSYKKMLKTYSDYYGKKVVGTTIVKIVKFRLI